MAETYELKDLGDGHFSLSGEASFHTVADILKDSLEMFEDHTMIELDLEQVTKTDSAGLALLLEWTTWANHTVREIHFRNIPEKLTNIARTSDVEELLSVGERWVGFIDERGPVAGETEEGQPESA